jgi:hypothetical protein
MKKITTIILAVLFTANLMSQVPNYVPTNGLQSWFPFSGNANDLSSFSNNGTVNGATLTTDRFGNLNSAYLFNGINNYIELPLNTGNLSGVDKFSISYWINPSSTTGIQIIFQ